LPIKKVPRETFYPVLKWPGGKRWIADKLIKMFPEKYGVYYEPFFGGGAIFFNLRPLKSVLSDINSELIKTYDELKNSPEDIISELSKMRIGKKTFYDLRKNIPQNNMLKAVRFIYLNKSAFNGMFRVNKLGLFNVPYGCKRGTVLCDETAIGNASKALANSSLIVSDFEAIIDRAKNGDLVYADPPYTVKHDNNCFRRYNESIFSWQDQLRLVKTLRRASQRGVKIFVSNAHNREVKIIYKGFKSLVFNRVSRISGNPEMRGTVSEYLFYAN